MAMGDKCNCFRTKSYPVLQCWCIHANGTCEATAVERDLLVVRNLPFNTGKQDSIGTSVTSCKPVYVRKRNRDMQLFYFFDKYLVYLINYIVF